jgi:hypothetical protein
MNAIINTQSVKTMSSIVIAELIGKDHKNIMRDARSMLELLGLDVLSFEQVYSDAYGRKQPCKIGPDVFDTHKALVTSCSAIYPSFKRAAGDCPACMMAALRLRKVPVPMMEDFSFKREMVQIFADLDDVPSNAGGY